MMAIVPHVTSSVWIPETEFSGTVAEVGPIGLHIPGKARLSEGDEVFGIIGPGDAFKYNGVLAEYVLVPRGCVVLKPQNLTDNEAAGVCGGGCTGISMFERAGLLQIRHEPDGPNLMSLATGKRILVTGGSTGTGQIVVQLAKYLVGSQGEVVTTASPRNFDSLQRLGIDNIVDYTKNPRLHEYFTEHNSSAQFDAIVDIVGTDYQLFKASPSYLKPDGVFIFSGAMSATHADSGEGILDAMRWIVRLISTALARQMDSYWPTQLGGVPRQCFFQSATPTATNLELLRELIAEGHVKATVDSVWEMDDALKAYDRLLFQRICGKVVVRVAPSR